MKRVAFAFVVLFLACPAAAREPGQTGLTVGFPGSIGIVWHASKAIAVRPDFSFNRTESKGEAPSTVETNSWRVGLGLSALFYAGKVGDKVRTYFSPRCGYSRTNVESDSSTSLTFGSRVNSYDYSGSFGVQYSATSRFSVYGEAGVTYGRSDSTADAPAFGRTTGSSLASRAGVGIVLYFN